MTPSRDISRLLEIMAQLRTPGSGCPWDLEQNFATIAPYAIEEAHEVADAIARGDLDDLRDELGDLLLQVVFHARMAEEQNAFAFGDVVEAITRKMIRRHPHVFADKDGQVTPSHVKGAWERIKAEEKAERAARRPPEAVHKSLLSGVKTGQPALKRAMDLQRKASSVGFDWNDPRAVLHKIREEADEIEAALAATVTNISLSGYTPPPSSISSGNPATLWVVPNTLNSSAVQTVINNHIANPNYGMPQQTQQYLAVVAAIQANTAITLTSTQLNTAVVGLVLQLESLFSGGNLTITP